jgi:putative heme-binding domain-containing protein
MGRRILQERASGRPIDRDAIQHLKRLLFSGPDVARRLRAFWALHVVDEIPAGDWPKLVADPEEQIRKWAIRLALQQGKLGSALLARILNREEQSPVVRLSLASALQQLSVESQWALASKLIQHGEDADDQNLPLMYWYGIEPLISIAPQQSLALARESKIPLVTQFIIRRAAEEPSAHEALFDFLSDDVSSEDHESYLDEVLQGFEGRVNITMPRAWLRTYDVLSRSESDGVRNRADAIAVLLGDVRVFPKLRDVVTDEGEPIDKRLAALEILVRTQDNESAHVLLAALDVPKLRATAIRALSGYDIPETPGVLLEKYNQLPESERRDVISTLTARPAYATALLKAVGSGAIPRTDLHAYHVQQMLRLKDTSLREHIEQVWGAIRETDAQKQQQIAVLKRSLRPAVLKAADPSSGRAVFAKTCSACHALFGDGGKVGPDLTGSNRANLDYVLQNIIDPSAVLGKDYRQSVIVTTDGRVVSGLVQRETDSALTLRTINDTVVIARDDIEERSLSELSMMPERLLETLSSDQIRDLVAYLGSPVQVPLKGPKSPIADSTRRVPDAIEGESLKVLDKTNGTPRNQPMGKFTKDRWSGDDHLWWTGAKPGDRLQLEVPVAAEGVYALEVVLTRAKDYGIVQLSCDDEPLGGPIDLYNSPDVVTTGVLSFPARKMRSGSHTFGIEVVGTNPQAVKSYMVGLDYLRLVPQESSP